MSFFGNKIGSRICIIALLPSFLLTSCAPPPYIAERAKITDSSLSCSGIVNEIALAKQHKKEARAQDNFQFKYMLIVPAVIGMFQWDKAEKSAQERVDYLQELYNNRNCRAELILEQRGKLPTQQQPINPYAPTPYNPAAPSNPYAPQYNSQPSYQAPYSGGGYQPNRMSFEGATDIEETDTNSNNSSPFIKQEDAKTSNPQQDSLLHSTSVNTMSENVFENLSDSSSFGPIQHPSTIPAHFGKPPAQFFTPKRPDENGQSQFVTPPLTVLHNDPNFVLEQ